MIIKIVLATAAALAVFLGYVASRDGNFRCERSGVIQASPEKIYPYLSSFRLGKEWSPFEQKDPNIKETYAGPDGQPGSTLEFEGNSEVGAGHLEILSVVPNESVEIKLVMTKPFRGENLVHYSLAREATGTKFTWAMSGDGGFMGKLMSTFFDCEKMIGGEFEKGIQNLKTLVESKREDKNAEN